MENNNSVLEFYEKYNENGRLSRNPIEFIRTKEIISRYLPAKTIKIIDLCGASGHYAYWLAERGHEVHLMDFSQKHINEAKINEKNYNAKLVSLECGDARSLKYDNKSFDMVLLMGALYHLQEKEDRLQCLKEVHRILKNDGIAVFGYISRFASLMDGFKYGYIDDPKFMEIMETDIYTGKHNNPENETKYFTNAYFHSINDIYDELKCTKYCDIMVYAVEGFSTLLNDTEYINDKEKLTKLLHYIKATEQNIELMGISGHQLAVCKKFV